MPRIYYVGDDIPFKFTITEDNKGITPTAAVIKITDPSGTVQENNTAMAINGPEMTFTLQDTKVTVAGLWKAVVKATKPNGDFAQLKIEWEVLAT